MMTEMKNYDFMHRLEKPKSDYSNNLDNDTTQILCNLIENNLNSMSKAEKINMITKILSENKLDKELLKFYMLNNNPEKKSYNITDFLNKTINILKKFHRKAGGLYIEDIDWSVKKSVDSKGNLVYILVNTIDNQDAKDREVYEYLTSLCNYLNKLSNNIKVKFSLSEDEENKITLISLKLKQK